MTQTQPPADFRKSTYSSGDNDCVEVAPGVDEAWVQDTKDRDGGTLKFGRTAFDAFQRMVSAA